MSCHPRSINDDPNDDESVEYETVSYTVLCDYLTRINKGKKLPFDIKRAIQCETVKQEQLPKQEKIKAHHRMMDIPSKISPGMMTEAQEEDIDISKNTLCKVWQEINTCSDMQI